MMCDFIFPSTEFYVNEPYLLNTRALLSIPTSLAKSTVNTPPREKNPRPTLKYRGFLLLLIHEIGFKKVEENSMSFVS